MRRCSKCKTSHDLQYDFCPKCGNPLIDGFVEPEGSEFVKKAKSKRTRLILTLSSLLLVILLIIANTPNPFRSKMEFENATLSEVFTETQIEKSIQELCKKLAPEINILDFKTYSKRILTIEKQMSETARNAKKFVDNHSWVGATDEVSSLNVKIAAESTAQLKFLILSYYPKLSTRWADYQASNLRESFQAQAAQTCGFSSVSSKLAKYDSTRAALRTYAGTVPWYPDGFNPYGDGTLAWKWQQGLSCQLGDSCWHLKLISELTCPSGVYAEINIMDSSGNVIDYSNDSLPGLNPNQTAILEFSTYNANARTGDLVKIDCY